MARRAPQTTDRSSLTALTPRHRLPTDSSGNQSYAFSSKRLTELSASRAAAGPGTRVTPMIVGGIKQTDAIAQRPPSIFKPKTSQYEVMNLLAGLGSWQPRD